MEIIKLLQAANNGNFFFVEGTANYLPEFRYSFNGVTHWETEYKSTDHAYEFDKTLIVEPHLWIKMRKNETDVWSEPGRFIGKDASEIGLFMYENMLMFTKEGEEDKPLFDLSTLKGTQGLQGVAGAGLAITAAVFYDEMLLLPCTGAASSCNTCGDGITAPTNAMKTVLVLGDNRLHKIVEADWIGTTQYHKVSETDTVWVETTGAHLDLPVRFYGYDLSDPATIVDAQLENVARTGFPDGVKGTVWVCGSTGWINVGDISQPDYRMAPNAANSTLGKYADAYVLGSSTLKFVDNTFYEVNEDSIEAKHFPDGTFAHGFAVGNGTVPIKIDPAQLVGWGLISYLDTVANELKYALDLTSTVADGIETIADTSVNGAPVNKLKAKPEDLVAVNENPDEGGEGGAIGTYVSIGDGFKNFFVKVGGVIKRLADRLVVNADERTITALDASGELKVKLTDDVADGTVATGIQGVHIHKNAYNEAKGIQSVGHQAEIKLSDMLKFNTTTGVIEVAADGIRTSAINANAADSTKAIAIVAGKVALLINELQFQFNASTGVLEIKDAFTADNFADNEIVKTIQIGAGGVYSADLLRDLVKLNISGDTYVTVEKSTSTGAIEDIASWTIGMDTAALTTLISQLITDAMPTIGSTYWEALPKSASNSTLLGTELAKRIEFDTWYGNTMYTTDGTILRPAAGSTEFYKLGVSSGGALTTTPYTE